MAQISYPVNILSLYASTVNTNGTEQSKSYILDLVYYLDESLLGITEKHHGLFHVK